VDAARGDKPKPLRALSRSADCYWPLLLYFLASTTLERVGTFLSGWFQAWITLSVVTSAELMSYYRLRTVGVVLQCLTAPCYLLVNFIGIPFPFLAISSNQGMWSTLKELFYLYRHRWKCMVVLWLTTVAPMAVTFAGAMLGLFFGDYTTLLRTSAVSAVLVRLLSIGGVMGMFLLIEEWRSGKKMDASVGQVGLAGKENTDEVRL